MMIKSAMVAVSAVMLLAPSSSAMAPVETHGGFGGVHIDVWGSGTHVKSVRAWAKGATRGERFRAYVIHAHSETRENLSGWRLAKRHGGMHSVTWAPHADYRSGSLLCVESSKRRAAPCATIHS
ncbi:hypothetical protein ABT127_30135 [Streptomyces sp. NPDC001904]|uniref:hypothetical protein n=1 Tax=Streptomyces sp. NPDC001904 TaxID=3154531 RepID=UPI003319A8D3